MPIKPLAPLPQLIAVSLFFRIFTFSGFISAVVRVITEAERSTAILIRCCGQTILSDAFSLIVGDFQHLYPPNHVSLFVEPATRIELVSSEYHTEALPLSYTGVLWDEAISFRAHVDHALGIEIGCTRSDWTRQNDPEIASKPPVGNVVVRHPEITCESP